jgi:predicted dehydrogenase
MPVTLGFIGAGNINRTHLSRAQQLNLPLLGIADVQPAAAEQAASQFPIEKTYTDHRELLADNRITAVIIGTPNKFHAQQAIDALQAGKHVFLEKPMAMNVAESDAIVAAMRKSGKIVQIGMVNRFKGSLQTLRHFIDAGRCGQIYSAQSFWFRRRGIPGFGGWFTTKELSGGGALIDIGVHLLDLTLYLMGFPKPVAVSGMTYNIWQKLEDYTYTSMWGKPTPGGKKDVDDYAVATVRFDQGQTLQFNVSWALNVGNVNPDLVVRIMGDKGGVSLNGIDEPYIHTEEAGHIVDIKPQYPKNDANLDQIQDFVDCIERRREPVATAEQGRTVQSILDAIYRSSAEQREVKVE